jgi:predicted DNA-binding transcriptional regulator AlpA
MTKPRVDTAYPPRGMRADRAAAYLDMSPSSFLRLVEEKKLPAGVPIKGMVVWDRYELDSAFENFKDRKRKRRNSADEALGINTDDADDD